MKMATKRCSKHYESERASMNKKDCFNLLPDDLIIEILQTLPPDILRYKIKFVCKRWFNIITNIILLDHASLILEKHEDECLKVRLMDIREENEGLKMKDQYIDMPYYNGTIKAWCNEYLLMTNLNARGYLYVFNLITKERLFLPSYPILCGGHCAGKCGLGLSYDGFKGVYKVVHVSMGPPIQCEVLIFNDDLLFNGTLRWKQIDGPCYTGQREFDWDDPVSVQGRYFHWDVHSCTHLVSMDTVKESFRQTRLPGLDYFSANNPYSFVEMGGFLTLFFKDSPEIINVWVLKDFQKTKWVKLHSIAVTSSVRSSIYPGNNLPFPITSVKSGRYLIFWKPGWSDNGLYSYDLKDKVMKMLDIVIAPMERCVVQQHQQVSFKEIKHGAGYTQTYGEFMNIIEQLIVY